VTARDQLEARRQAVGRLPTGWRRLLIRVRVWLGGNTQAVLYRIRRRP